MSEWQPIETAPRDGTAVILALDKPLHSRMIERHVPFVECQSCMGWWEDDGWVLPFMEEGTSDSFGYSTTFYMGQLHPLPVRPTHWMPLPAPPAGQT